RGAELPPEVLLGDDVGGVEGPRGGELHPELLEGHRAVAVVGDAGIPPLPLHPGVGVLAAGGEVATDTDAYLLGCEGHGAPITCSWHWGVLEYNHNILCLMPGGRTRATRCGVVTSP